MRRTVALLLAALVIAFGLAGPMVAAEPQASASPSEPTPTGPEPSVEAPTNTLAPTTTAAAIQDPPSAAPTSPAEPFVQSEASPTPGATPAQSADAGRTSSDEGRAATAVEASVADVNGIFIDGWHPPGVSPIQTDHDHNRNHG